MSQQNNVLFLTFQGETQLQWVDNRNVSYMGWNNVFITRTSPIEMSLVNCKFYNRGPHLKSISFNYVSLSLISIASEVLQPNSWNGAHECGYLMVTSRNSASDWFMGPCNEKTNPGTFLCRINTNRINLVVPTNELSFMSDNTVTSNVTCPHRWILLKGWCFQIYEEDRMELCPNRNVYIEDESTVSHLRNWLSYYIKHNAFNCAEIAYSISSGELKILYESTSAIKLRRCVVCVAEVKAVMKCPQGLFQCNDGSCVSPAALCDGKWDCGYGEDEAECDAIMCHINNIYQNHEFCQMECSTEKHNCLCGLGFWQCRNGGCVPISKFCDLQEDCGDASDEVCQLPRCNDGKVECKNRQCVPKLVIFDFQRRCLDNSDENEHKYSYSHVIKLSCRSSAKQIPAARISDFIPDCPSSYDEPLYLQIVTNRHQTKKNPCLSGYLPCMHFHSQCFPLEKLCVYELDTEQEMLYCRNGFHTRDCKSFPCAQAFKCASSYCIPVHYVCNGHRHCPDGEDEQHCSIIFTTLCQRKDLIKLGHNLPPYVHKHFMNGTCISAIIPIHDEELKVVKPGKGELSLSNHLSCPGLFHCQYGQCLHPSLLCDGIIHCPLFADDETSCVDDSCTDDCSCLGKTVNCNGTQHEDIPLMATGIHQLVFTHNLLTHRLYSLNLYVHLLKADISFNNCFHFRQRIGLSC